jgi:hypothetical protein
MDSTIPIKEKVESKNDGDNITNRKNVSPIQTRINNNFKELINSLIEYVRTAFSFQ